MVLPDRITKLKSKEEMGMFCSADIQVMFWYIYLGGTKQLSLILIFPQFNFCWNWKSYVFMCVSACWRRGKPQERQVQQGCLQGQRTGPDHHEISPVPAKTTRDSEECPAECLPKEEGGHLESRWAPSPTRADEKRHDVEEHLEQWQVGSFGTIFSCVAPGQYNRDTNLMGLRWDSSVLWNVRWPVWTHHLAPPQ